MNLFISIGNSQTQILCPTPAGNQTASFPTASDLYERLAKPALDASRFVSQVVIVSVVPARNHIWVDLCRKIGLPRPAFLSAEAAIRAGLRIKYHPRKNLGADRIAAALGAMQLAPGRDRIVVDAGTAVTVDAVSKDNVFQGGFIFPGLDLSAKALSAGTALLPLVKPKAGAGRIGRSTATSIELGIANMVRGGVLECIRQLEKQLRLKKPTVLMTGGAIRQLFKPSDNRSYIFEADLVFRGLQYWVKTYNV